MGSSGHFAAEVLVSVPDAPPGSLYDVRVSHMLIDESESEHPVDQREAVIEVVVKAQPSRKSRPPKTKRNDVPE